MKQVNMLRYVTLRYVNYSFKLSRLFYCKNLLKNIFDLFGKSVIASALKRACCQTKQSKENRLPRLWLAMTIKNIYAFSFIKKIRHYEGNARSNLFSADCFSAFAMTIKNIHAFSYGLKNKFFQKWIASGKAFAMTIKNIHAFSFIKKIRHYEGNARSNLFSADCFSALAMTIKNQFEIISRNENYAFNHNKNFCRNGNNQSLRGIENAEVIQNRFKYWIASLLRLQRALASVARNDKFVICDDKSKDDLFSRNDYGKDFIFGFWNNSNFGFLFNRKINSTKKLHQGEQK